jgi:hypothetical protein
MLNNYIFKTKWFNSLYALNNHWYDYIILRKLIFDYNKKKDLNNKNANIYLYLYEYLIDLLEYSQEQIYKISKKYANYIYY